MQEFYEILGIPKYAAIISASLLRECTSDLEDKPALKRLVHYVETSLSTTTVVSISVYIWAQFPDVADAVKQYGTTKLAAYVVSDMSMEHIGKRLLTGNLYEALYACDPREGFVRNTDYEWEVICDVNIDKDRALPVPSMYFSNPPTQLPTNKRKS